MIHVCILPFSLMILISLNSDMESCSFIVVILLIIVQLSWSNADINDCKQKLFCGDCIVAGADCAWCSDEGFTEIDAGNSRCSIAGDLIAKGCRNITDPKNSLRLIEDEPVRDGEGHGSPIQIQPQEMYIKIRPHEPQHFKLTFRLARDYPVDLYYLMDFSNSMDDDLQKLAQLSKTIADSMANITKNFQLGFGTFVDKVVMPYVSTIPDKLVHPCKGCDAPYSFRNQLSLTSSGTSFESKIRETTISGNLDAPEGGFDAIMQAVMCKKEIGWRNVSRKLLLFSTDAGFHFAGDGKLGGIVEPNDCMCHLDEHGKYTEGENQDYPSVSQIATKIREKNINAIFAVTSDQVSVYNQLSNYIEGSVTTELAGDSSNIVPIIKDNYRRISSKVEMKTRDAEGITVKFMSSCLSSDPPVETAICEGLKITNRTTFDVSVQVDSCPKDTNNTRKSFTIYPVGLYESLKVTLDIICDCDCEKPENADSNSKFCNGSGTYQCGKCKCNPGRYGDNCQCDGSEDSEEDLQKCRPENSTSSLICSGRGECECGTCKCDSRHAKTSQRYSGKYCQCDDYSCSYHQNQLCGGKGSCDCGKCKCTANYTGEACECPLSIDTCLTSNKKICNDVGNCVCGRCQCNTTMNYRGPTCEECPTCPGKCTENKNCVLCKAHQSGPLSSEECQAKCGHVTLVDHIDTEAADKNPDVHLCQFKDADDCVYYFTYEYGEKNEAIVKAQSRKECPEPVNPLPIVLGTVGGIVALGLIALLIWKLYTTIHDKMEFARFQKEADAANWDTSGNPIYQQATTTFANPTFGK